MDYFKKLRDLFGSAGQAVQQAAAPVVQEIQQAPQQIMGFGKNLLSTLTAPSQNTQPQRTGLVQDIINSRPSHYGGDKINLNQFDPFLPTPQGQSNPYYKALDTLSKYQQGVGNYVENRVQQPIQAFKKDPNIMNGLMAGAGLFNATPAGIGTNIVTGVGAGRLHNIRTGAPLDQSIGEAITNNVSPTQYATGTNNPLLAFAGDVAIGNPKSAISAIKNPKAFVKQLPNAIQDLKSIGKASPETALLKKGDEIFGPILQDITSKKQGLEDLISNTPPPTENIPQLGKQRGFLRTIEKSKNTSPELRAIAKSVDPQTYQVLPNKVTLAGANNAIAAGVDEAKARVFSDEPATAEKTAIGIQLSRKYQSEGNLDEAINVIEKLDKDLRQSGRSIQAASMWNKLSPEGMLRAATRVSEKVGVKLDDDGKKLILQGMADIQKMAEGADKDKATVNLLSSIAQKLPPKFGEVFDAYRYQNMLSNPKTHIRNIYSNMFNTLITRPMDLGIQGTYDLLRHPFNPMARDASILDVPRHYKDVLTALPNAVVAASQAFKKANLDNLDLSHGDTAIEALRKQNMPISMSVVPRLLQAQDGFFSALISAGEKARQMAHGIDEESATKSATDLAERYLYRDKLGSQKDSGLFVQALDSLGQFAMKGRNLPVVGKPYGWFVPFITTPVNAAKAMVEHSPLGFVPGGMKKLNPEQIAKATAGSIVTGIGAMTAMQGRTTWDAPTDKKAKDLFYASGKKPFSILVGDRWVPMWYAGPFAMALAIPAAVQYNQEESKTALTDDQVTKLTNIAGQLSKFVVSQSSLQSVGGFFRMLDGDQDITSGSSLAFTLGQAIPLQGLIRYVNQLVDPVYRKGTSFVDAFKKDIPGLSQSVKPYTNPDGTVSQRDPFNRALPYDTGKRNPEYEPLLDMRTEQLQQNAVMNKEKKALEQQVQDEMSGAQAAEAEQVNPLANQKSIARNKMQEDLARTKVQLKGGIQETADKYFFQENGQVKSVAKDPKADALTLTGDPVVDKQLIADYKGSVTSAVNDTITLYKLGKFTLEQTRAKIDQLKATVGGGTAKPKKLSLGQINSFAIKKTRTAKSTSGLVYKGKKLGISKTLKPKLTILRSNLPKFGLSVATKPKSFASKATTA